MRAHAQTGAFFRMLAIAFGVIFLSDRACPEETGSSPTPPPMMREFRGVWVATVKNIDWPSKRGLSGDEQQHELIKILDKCVELNLNAVVLQIRTEADAFYPSKLEPWSEFLSGKMGQPPKPYYDPLAFAVKEAHQRGLQLHVWFNPYRVRVPDEKEPVSPDHASVAHADAVRKYGKYLWYDPGEPAAEENFVAVLNDVVNRYDIDGVHIDDYFYPYEETDKAGKIIPFPDNDSYARAKSKGETLELKDWRRQNVNHLIHRMYDEVKKAKPWVLVGISPFGIWRPGNPPEIKGFDQYDKLYADARKWEQEGWLDYLTPQLYWSVTSTDQNYAKLLGWWSEQNAQKRHLWPGNFTSRLKHKEGTENDKGAKASKVWLADEIISQIEATRSTPGATGNVHFSMKAFTQDYDGIDEKLKNGLYSQPALVPETTWLGDDTPPKPTVSAKATKSGVNVTMNLPSGKSPWQWLIRARMSTGWHDAIVPGDRAEFDIKSSNEAPTEVIVSAISRLVRESQRSSTKVEQLQ
jgi:uncharacterized lipoprotein YddW (UPF0748 family)